MSHPDRTPAATRPWRAADPKGTGAGTIHLADHLLVTGKDTARSIALLREVAAERGWIVAPETDTAEDAVRVLRSAGADTVTRLRITRQPGAAEPDASGLLEAARAREPHLAAGLDHAVFLAAFHPQGPGMYGTNGIGMYGTNGIGMYGTNGKGMYGTNGVSPASSYQLPGAGGRSPVAVVLRAPDRGEEPADPETRRPAIGFLDSGCGQHPWLADVVRRRVPGSAAQSSAEEDGDQLGPLDGVLDAVAGHGTFIAGMLRQRAPHADLYSWRICDGAGVVPESDLLSALENVADLVAANREDPGTGVGLDVLCLSLGFYPEDPDEADDDHILRPSLERLTRLGVTVVLSAGNEATNRPFYPAAYAGAGLSGAPVLSVGARNPNGTIALFSNTGDWVTTYATGAALVSTSPPLRGGLQPLAARESLPGGPSQRRESLDPDDYSAPDPGNPDEPQGGFAIWSGTSFAAPVVAAEVAVALGRTLPRKQSGDDAVARARDAVARAGLTLPETT
ncbi:S8/S53 family peptidase [Serinibacter salmoneus]|uniref:Subtilase family protein n=1 Tax=Serinibacter salmoneus TaxID=556530 RepID=A0A2A9CYG8_9MICO|nr:S8/S53 family peptidase [Serinibacter salmoneus]PFG18629.1 subtilase family protein [Serinibacter salmoneus]